MTFKFKVADQELISDCEKKIKSLENYFTMLKISRYSDLDRIFDRILYQLHRKCSIKIDYPEGYSNIDLGYIPDNATITVDVKPAVKDFGIQFKS